MLQFLERHQLVLNGGKCEWEISKVAYIGHVGSLNGVTVGTDKVAAIKTWPLPKKTSKNLRVL